MPTTPSRTYETSRTTRFERKHPSLARKPQSIKRSAADKGVRRQSTVVVRKKLPWLDGPRIPGQFESKDSLDEDEPQEQRHEPQFEQSNTRPDRLPASSIDQDPALRAVGSTPSLRKGTKHANFTSLSLNSQPRPGVRPIMSKGDAARALGTTSIKPEPAKYSSSLYSVTPSGDDGGPATILPQQDASSYERLLVRPAPVNDGPDHHTDFDQLQSPNHVTPDQDISPKHESVHQPRWQERQAISKQQTQAPRQQRRSDSCVNCDASVAVNDRIRRMPKAKTLPRPSVAAPPIQPPRQPSFAPPARKPTLFAMPDHLMQSSSSSTPSKGRAQSIAVPRAVAPSYDPPAPPSQAVRAGDVYRNSQSLNRAVTGLENLMEEALNVAKNAAQTGRNDEVAHILDNATLALRKASVVHGNLNDGRMAQPLVLSPRVSEGGSSSCASASPTSSVSSLHGGARSVDTAPTMLTKSAKSSQQPMVVNQRKSISTFPGSLKASVETFNDPRDKKTSPDRHSFTRTPPRLYQPPSADSIVRDFAYSRARTSKSGAARRKLTRSYGSAADYYGDTGQSVVAQPGVRPSVSAPMITDKPLPGLPAAVQRPSISAPNRVTTSGSRLQKRPLQQLSPKPIAVVPARTSSRTWEEPAAEAAARKRRPKHHRAHLSDVFEAGYYRQHPDGASRSLSAPQEKPRTLSTFTETTTDPNDPQASAVPNLDSRYSFNDPSPTFERNLSLKHPRRHHISLREGQGFSLGRFHRRQPIAREWSTSRKRITAGIACLNTVFVGLIAGIYAGEVPKIQYQLADTSHQVILGNVVLFACLGLTTLIAWPLPLLHGRKPYTLLAFALMLPLMFPQALVVSGYRNPNNPIYRCGLLIPRAFEGTALGFANINFLPTLFDLFGASLMSTQPHQEIVLYDDVRRQGGGVGIWLGVWSFCFVGGMSIGFCVGACIISALSPSWGFYLIVILLAFFLLVNVVAPETRRAPYRRSIAQFFDSDEETVKRRVARGEVKLHICNDGPKWWWEEVWAGLVLTKRMCFQPGFAVLMAYLGWMYAQVTLVILFLGALLSRDYKWQPQYVGPAVLSVAIGSALALPLSKANLFSRARDNPQRTDSMTLRAHKSSIHWSSHMLRRCIFTLTLPFAAIAYTLSAMGPSVSWTTPTVFCGLVGFLSTLAIAECVGLVMETFDTCDLQPGVNSRHRTQSLAETTRRRRTNYSSFPRVCAGFFAAQSLGFFLSAAATGVSGDVTRAVGAQTATAIVAGILMGLTVLFIAVLWRWRTVQVIPDGVLAGTVTSAGGGFNAGGWEDKEWKAVVIGCPSGKLRRVNMLELGGLSRWSEIRALNRLGERG